MTLKDPRTFLDVAKVLPVIFYIKIRHRPFLFSVFVSFLSILIYLVLFLTLTPLEDVLRVLIFFFGRFDIVSDVALIMFRPQIILLFVPIMAIYILILIYIPALVFWIRKVLKKPKTFSVKQLKSDLITKGYRFDESKLKKMIKTHNGVYLGVQNLKGRLQFLFISNDLVKKVVDTEMYRNFADKSEGVHSF